MAGPFFGTMLFFLRWNRDRGLGIKNIRGGFERLCHPGARTCMRGRRKMHLKPVTKKAGGPSRGAIIEDLGEYEQSWLYLMLFLIAAVIVPQKL